VLLVVVGRVSETEIFVAPILVVWVIVILVGIRRLKPLEKQVIQNVARSHDGGARNKKSTHGEISKKNL
jgi:hypothetical protein